MKKLFAVALVIFALVLTGCDTGGSPESDKNAGNQSDELYERTIKLKDGRIITCIVFSTDTEKSGGLSCEWEK